MFFMISCESLSDYKTKQLLRYYRSKNEENKGQLVDKSQLMVGIDYKKSQAMIDLKNVKW